MTLTTAKFRLTPEVYFRVLVRNYVQSWWWVHLLLVALAGVAQLVAPGDPFTSFLSIVALGLPVYYWWRFRRHAFAVENRVLFRSRQLEIDETSIRTSDDQGSEGTLLLADLCRARRGPDYHLLYVTRTQFLYLPDSAFQSDTDRKAFEDLLAGRGIRKA